MSRPEASPRANRIPTTIMIRMDLIYGVYSMNVIILAFKPVLGFRAKITVILCFSYFLSNLPPVAMRQVNPLMHP